MKKHIVLLPIILTLSILASCASDGNDASAVTEAMRNTVSASYVADITAHFPSREVCFKLDYTYRRDGDDGATVLSPDEIAGMSFTLRDGSSSVSFDGAELEMGRLNDNNFSPLFAVPTLIKTWTGGNITESQNTKIYGSEAYLIISRTSENGVSLEMRSWFAKDGLLPLYAEIFSDGERVIQCNFERAEHNLQ